jgi:hypothetical protein
MQDRPTIRELLAAVRHFIETDVVPKLEGPKKFHARVAANVLDIVQRELELEAEQLQREYESLAALLGMNESAPRERELLHRSLRERTEELCRRIAGGAADAGEWREAVLAHVRLTVRAKLQVANPKYLAADDRLRSPKGSRP